MDETPIIENYLDELWQQFVEKITADWEINYKQFGENLKGVHSEYGDAMNFANEVRNNMKSALKEQNVTLNDKLSAATLHSYFIGNKITSNKTETTIKFFCQYLNYANFDSFKKQNIQAIKLKIAERERKKLEQQIENNPIENNSKNSKTAKFRNYILIISSIILVGICGFFTNKYWYSIFKDPYLQTYINTVYKADSSEFECYKMLPKIDTSEVDKYFTKSGTAKRRIVNLIIEHQKKGLILTNPRNPCFYRIEYCRMVGKDKKKGEVYMETKESWFLEWYDVNTKTYRVGYNETNVQQYILRQEDNTWKVDYNIYEGEPYKMNF